MCNPLREKSRRWFWMVTVAGLAACSRSPAKSAAPAPVLQETAVVRQFREDLKKVMPDVSADELERKVQAYAQDVELAAREPYPLDHAACIKVTRTRPTLNCPLVVGDVVKPKWFAACVAQGGATMKNAAPEGTPLHPDRNFCTRIFALP